jgi:hypothetical protein
MGILPVWAELEPVIPQITAMMRRYLAQIGCVLGPGSVSGADLALRSFAAFLTEAAPEVSCLASRRSDLDETRRLASMALAAWGTERYELAATIVNALAHHQSAVDPDVAMRHVTAIVANGSGDTSQSEAPASWAHRPDNH